MLYLYYRVVLGHKYFPHLSAVRMMKSSTMTMRARSAVMKARAAGGTTSPPMKTWTGPTTTSPPPPSPRGTWSPSPAPRPQTATTSVQPRGPEGTTESLQGLRPTTRIHRATAGRAGGSTPGSFCVANDSMYTCVCLCVDSHVSSRGPPPAVSPRPPAATLTAPSPPMVRLLQP